MVMIYLKLLCLQGVFFFLEVSLYLHSLQEKKGTIHRITKRGGKQNAFHDCLYIRSLSKETKTNPRGDCTNRESFPADEGHWRMEFFCGGRGFMVLEV